MGSLPEHRWTPCLRDGLFYMYWHWEMSVSLMSRIAFLRKSANLLDRLENGILSGDRGPLIGLQRRVKGPLFKNSPPKSPESPQSLGNVQHARALKG